MAKLLIVKDNTRIKENNINDVIARYTDDYRLYTREELLNLTEILNLKISIKNGDEKKIEEDILALIKAISTEEQYLIMTGLFDLINVDKTLNEIETAMSMETPETKEMWLDKETGKWKELITRPQAALRYTEAGFRHNYGIPVENTKIANDEIAEVVKS